MAIPYQPTFTINPKYGFRYAAQPHIPNVSNGNLNTSQATPPPVMGTQQSTPPQPQQQTVNYSDDPFPQGIDNRPIAQSLGYTAPRSNIAAGLGTIAGMATGVPFLGTMASAASNKLDQSGQPAYGSFGTYDIEGNVFGEQGRAYNPITGAAANSYASPQDWGSSWLGIGSDEGFLGSGSSYGKLRAEGENIGSSLLGSYDNSVYNVSRYDRMMGMTPSSRANVSSVLGQARMNTQGLAPGETPATINASDLGFTGQRMGEPTTTSGMIGTNAGDIFVTPGSYQPGVVMEGGGVMTPSGTLVQVTDANGKNYSLLGKDEAQTKSILDTVNQTFKDKDIGQKAKAEAPYASEFDYDTPTTTPTTNSYTQYEPVPEYEIDTVYTPSSNSDNNNSNNWSGWSDSSNSGYGTSSGGEFDTSPTTTSYGTTVSSNVGGAGEHADIGNYVAAKQAAQTNPANYNNKDYGSSSNDSGGDSGGGGK